MKRTLIYALRLALITLVAVVTHAQAAGLTIATYNVENYTLADRLVEGVYRKAYPKPEAEKTALRTVIHQINADILTLQEMGSAPFLTELQRDLRSEGLDYPYSAVMNSGDPDRKLAVLSKCPFSRIITHDDLSFKYFETTEQVKRGLLEVRIPTKNGTITLFVVHLKSRFTSRPDDPASALQRTGEAVAIRDRILTLFPHPESATFMILGDFNDNRTSRPLKAMLARGQTTIAEWLPAADERGHVWSHFYRREDTYSRVDHILVSAQLKPRINAGEGRLHATPAVEMASDHRPLIVVID